MRNIILFLLVFGLAVTAHSETIKLKSGNIIDGNIIERNDEYIKVDINIGVPVTYYLDELQSIDGVVVEAVDKEAVAVEEVTSENKKDLLSDEPKEDKALEEFNDKGKEPAVSGKDAGYKEVDWDALNDKLEEQEAESASTQEEQVSADIPEWNNDPYDYKRYGVKSGILELTQTGNTKGKITYYFDKWGMREATYDNSETTSGKEGAVKLKTNRITLLDGDMTTSINMNKKTGFKMRNTMPFMKADEMGTKDITEVSIQTIKDMGMKKVGTEKIQGKKCDLWVNEELGTKQCIWKGLPLMMEIGMMGKKVVMKATKLKVNVKIPEAKFQIPRGVKISTF